MLFSVEVTTFEKDFDKLESYRAATELIQGLENLAFSQRLKKLNVCSLTKGSE